MTTLPEPKIANCYSDEVFQPYLSAMDLDWKEESSAKQSRFWELPEGVLVNGPAPVRFGICVRRRDLTNYSLRLVWNQTHLAWSALTRRQLLDSCLGSLLAALGTDFQYLLDQPIAPSETPTEMDERSYVTV